MLDGNDDLALNIGVSLQKLNRQLAKVESDFQKAARKQENAFKKANEKAAREFEKLRDSANRSLGGIKMPGLAGLGAGLGAALSTRELIRMTDTWTDLSSRVGLAVGEMDRAPEVMERISSMARRTYSSLEQTAESYLANATTLRELGLSTEESLNYTEALNNALVVSGAKAQVAASVQDALAKAMALGKLSGEQLNTVIGRGGRVAELLAEELGVTVNALRKMGADGKITGDVIDRALRGNLEKLRAEADSMPATIGDAFQLLKNAMLEYVGSTDKGIGASEKVAAAMIAVADNIDKVVAVGGVLLARVLGPAAAAVLARMAAQFTATAAAIRGMGTAAAASTVAVNGLKGALALVGGPLGLVLAAVAVLPAVTTSTAERTRNLKAAGEGAATALEAFADASKRAKDEQGGLGNEVSRVTQNMLSQSRAALQVERERLAGEAAEARSIAEKNARSLARVLSPVDTAGTRRNPALEGVAEGLRAIGDGKGDVAGVAREMERLSGVGSEVSELLAEIDAGLASGKSGRALREASEELVKQANLIGGFERELAALMAAPAGSAQRVQAFRDLRQAMTDAAQAGEVLRRSVFDGGTGLRSQLEELSSAETAMEAVKAALRGNLDEAKRLINLSNPFRTVEAGANSATAAVNSLKAAMENLPKEINARISGLEGATDGATASAALLRQFEGFRPTPYWDVNAHRVGFGSDTITLSDGTIQRVTAGMRVSVEDANRDLVRRVGEFQGVIRGQIGGSFDSFNPAQQAALTSIAYNYGSLPDRIVAAIRSGDNTSIVTAIASLQDHNGGVNRDRRLAEAAIFDRGIGVEAAATRQEAEALRLIAEAESKAKQAAKERADEAERGVKVRGDLLSQAQQQVADAGFELTLMGKTAAEQARLRTLYMLTNEAKQNGIDLNERLAGSEKTYGQVISEQAAQIGEYVAQQERRAAAAQNAAEREQFMAQVQADLKNGLLDAIVAGESFADTLGNIAKMLAKAALEAALFGSGPFSSGGGGGLLGGLFSAFGGGGGSVSAWRPRSFEGGGFTGYGARSGGVDGRGGIPAILHPNETVIDHTRGQRAGGGMTFAPTINVGGNVTQDDIARIHQVMDVERRNFIQNVRKAQSEIGQRYN